MTVQVGRQRLTLSDLDKVLYPADGFTKGEVINYYSRIAEVLLPHLAGSPVTFIRFPDGVGDGKQQFFEKNVPNGAPDWLPTVALPSTGSRSGRGGGTITYALLNELPALVWAANMAALELHVPQWKIDPAGGRLPPDRLVLDLDPGPFTGLAIEVPDPSLVAVPRERSSSRVATLPARRPDLCRTRDTLMCGRSRPWSPL
ncbi:hypothetical protein AB0M80_41545 [Amycolatopsis sp. NPDC051045]|uniref:non-homologous end-joining DNA ligase LigD n=1 Tax=Amycolatopsis sp. NPDC051045 TaxID=3156922 RepID=UPI00341328AC